jgi:DNA modification methylase
MEQRKIEHTIVDIDSIETHPKNVRQGDIGAISESLQAHGQYRPIVVDKRTNRILAGNHTWKAAKALGWTEINAGFIETKDDDEALRILLADNRTTDLASYDDSGLAELLKQLADTEIGLEGTAFDGDDLDSLLKDLGHFELPTDVDEIPEDVPAISKLGDVWLLGEHRVMCGDSTNENNFDQLMNGQKAEMVFTDPPYRYKQMGDGGVFGEAYKTLKKDLEGLTNFDPNTLLSILPKIFAKGMNAYIFCNTDLVPDYCIWARKNNFNFNILTWHKTSFIPASNNHHYPDTEYLIYISKSAVFNTGLKINYGKYWVLNNEKHKDHPTIKPVEIISNEMQISSNSGGLIVDLFGGSGSTLIAAQQTNRTCYTMELDPHYVDVICARYQKHTGNQPILEATGEAHDFNADH